MAKQQSNSNLNQSRTFVKGLSRDMDPSFIQDGMWNYARNAVNNTREGEIGTLSNEESNRLCGKIGADLIVKHKIVIVGAVPLFESKWVVFSVIYDASNTNTVLTSEIGLFEEDFCRYRPIVRDKCLKFSKFHLISGASREKGDCSWQIYWADGINPDRYLNIGDPKLWPTEDYSWLGGLDGTSTINYYSNNTTIDFLWPGVKWNEECDTVNDCIICTNLNSLDCEETRLASLVKTPCIDINIGPQQGLILNGSYTVGLTYTINNQSVTNYFSLSYIQPVFNEVDGKGSLEITIKDLDSDHFDQYQLCIVYINKSVANYKVLGYYSIDTKKIIIDQIPDTLENTSPTTIFKSNPAIETSEQLVEANRYLLKVGPKSRFDFNYQPLANLIRSEWVSIEYSERYYVNGGKNAGYLRDEVYAFFIRWVYDTGDKSASYHIPGRPPIAYNGILEAGQTFNNSNSFPGENQLFETINTATVIPQSPALDNGDGGKIIAYGDMGYWQSTEKYPSDRPNIWNSSEHCWTRVGTDLTNDLCGKNIRHHRFPENGLHPSVYHFDKHSNGSFHIRLMGVRFKDIVLPKDNDGNDIEGIVGYEILRGSRAGNKSIVAKGMLNNFRDYTLQGEPSNSTKVGLYGNYPFNTIRPNQNTSGAGDYNNDFNDPYILSRAGIQPVFENDPIPPFQNQDIPRSMLSFHSPDTSFRTPYLQMSELKVYGHLEGNAKQQFIEAPNHPEFQLLSDMIVLVGAIGGIVHTIFKQAGDIKVNYPAGKWEPQYIPDITGGDKNNKPAYQWEIADVGGVGVGGTTLNNVPAANIDTSIETDSNLLGNEDDKTDLDNANIDPNTVDDDIKDWKAFQNILSGILPGLSGPSFDENMSEINKKVYDKGHYLTLPTLSRNYTSKDVLPQLIQGLSTSFGEILFNFLEGVDITVDLLKSIASFRQYALELIGYGEYTNFKPSSVPINRFSIEDGIYMFSDIQDFPEYQNTLGTPVSYRINNLNRPHKAVIRVETPNGIQTGPDFITNAIGDTYDQSLMTLDTASTISTFDVDHTPEGKKKPFTNPIASHYGGLKFSIRNQYGQLNTVAQIVASPCEQKIDLATLGQSTGNSLGCPIVTQKKIQETSVFFGGDTYINRFTEKNIMPFFTHWLYKEPRGEQWNYFLYPSVPFPKFWANSEPWDISEININNLITSLVGLNQGTGLLPSAYYSLDNKNYDRSINNTTDYPGVITPKNSYFYLAACGIRDFFVESDVIVDFRVRGDFERQYHYDKFRYTDLPSLFSTNPEILKAGNYYNYDYSLSISQFFINQLYNFGALQSRDYDPTVARLCYTSSPNVINYSLPETQESIVESWRTFLPLNKVVFKNNVNSIKSYGKTGMFITFENASPLMYAGVDQREDYLGVAATIGDGLLFSATPRNVTAADAKYEYGSSQDRLGVVSSPAGLYFISQQQGKIFSFGDSLQELSSINMKWWFEEFLPYKLIEDFPNFTYIDNPVAGIGCSAGYDNGNSIIYFSKKDYMLKPEFKDKVTYLEEDNFSVVLDSDPTGRNKITVKLGDDRIFEDASWTVSFDPKTKQWVSFHDWHPNLYLSGRNKHYTTKLGGIWKHNAGCNNYCNFYNAQYPFEIGVPFPTGQTVTTVRSIEYFLECYRRDTIFCVDQFHVLDYNFDQAIIYNSGQISGYLNLNIFPKNNVVLAQEYPKINTNSIDILVSKVEHKYRFNQFWDITKDRGEFPDGAGYPPNGQLIPNTTRLLGNYPENQIWSTKANGYVQDLNQSSLDYNKPELQRKKFRHYTNFVKLIKKNSQNTNMVFKILNTKNQFSQR
jgi:hypothetical protein